MNDDATTWRDLADQLLFSRRLRLRARLGTVALAVGTDDDHRLGRDQFLSEKIGGSTIVR